MIASSVSAAAIGVGIDPYRCALLQSSAKSGLQERIDLGHAAQARGDDDGALLLLAGVGLEMGFGRTALAWWRETGSSTGLWSVSWDTPEDDPGLFCVDRAMREMRAVAATVATSLADDSVATVATLVPATEAQVVRHDASVPARVREALSAFLAQREPRVAPLFRVLAGELIDRVPPDVRHWAGAPDDALAELVGLQQLRRCMLTALIFLEPPLGSPKLLEHVARLADDGLGSWLGALPRLMRDGADLLAWSYAAGEGLLPDAALPSWAVLLAATAPRSRWRELMRQFGRLGLKAGLESVLYRFVHLPLTQSDGYEINDLRDVCLDQRLPDLAIAAQRQAVVVHSRSTAEQVILGDMLALAGKQEEALTIFTALLEDDPQDHGLQQRVVAARNGGLADYVATHDFFGSADHGYARRRGMLAEEPADFAILTGRRSWKGSW